MASKMTKRIGKSGKTTWTCLVDLPADPVTGKRRQKRLSTPTKKELETLVTETLHHVHTGTYIEASTATTGDYLTQWLAAVEPTIRPASYLRYTGAIKRHVMPALKDVPLSKLSGTHLQRFYADRLAAKLSPTTVAFYHAVLHRAFDQATRWRLITHNPCQDVDPPRPARPEMRTWTAEQTRAFLTGTAEHDLAALFRLALTLGMRQGELIGLRWEDVDLDRAVLAVRRTLTRDKTGGVAFGEPKSRAGRRSIALPASCVKALRQHKARQNARRLQWGDAWQDAGVVFDRGDGQPVHRNTARDAYRSQARRLGLPVIRFHDLRHTAATLALADGQHPKIVQERLGHSSIAMTLNRYSHVSMSMQQEAAERLERLLGG